MKKLTVIVSAIGMFLSTISCNKDAAIPKSSTKSPSLTNAAARQLTRQEKLNIAWADFWAGLGTASTGLLSFGIAGAASWLYYQENYARAGALTANTDPEPTDPHDYYGYYHNQLCRTFAANNYAAITFENMTTTAGELAPDLADEFAALSEDDYSEVVAQTLSHDDYVTSNSLQVEKASEVLDLNQTDLEVFAGYVDDINASQDDEEFAESLNNLKSAVATFSISSRKKDQLLNSLSILKYSYALWDLE